MTTAKEVASKLVEFYGNDRAKWLQGAYATDADGRAVLSQSDKAVCWCALGALRLLYGIVGDFDAQALVLEEAVGDRCLDDWNDTRTSFDQFIGELKAIAEAP